MDGVLTRRRGRGIMVKGVESVVEGEFVVKEVLSREHGRGSFANDVISCGGEEKHNNQPSERHTFHPL